MCTCRWWRLRNLFAFGGSRSPIEIVSIPDWETAARSLRGAFEFGELHIFEMVETGRARERIAATGAATNQKPLIGVILPGITGRVPCDGRQLEFLDEKE
jgi:hypothetical protein